MTYSIEKQNSTLESSSISQSLKTVDLNSLLQEGRSQSVFAPTTDHNSASLTPQDGSHIVVPASEGSDSYSHMMSGTGGAGGGAWAEGDVVPGGGIASGGDTMTGTITGFDGSQHLLIGSLNPLSAQNYMPGDGSLSGIGTASGDYALASGGTNDGIGTVNPGGPNDPVEPIQPIRPIDPVEPVGPAKSISPIGRVVFTPPDSEADWSDPIDFS